MSVILELVRRCRREAAFRLTISRQGGPDETSPWTLTYEARPRIVGVNGPSLEAAVEALLLELDAAADEEVT